MVRELVPGDLVKLRYVSDDIVVWRNDDVDDVRRIGSMPPSGVAVLLYASVGGRMAMVLCASCVGWVSVNFLVGVTP